MKVDLINNSSWNVLFLKQVVEFSIYGIKKYLPSFSIEFNDFYFEEDKDGNRTYDKNIDWDGTSWDDGVIWINLNPKVKFPLTWWVNEEIKGKYLNGMYLNSPEEFFIYMCSHEIFHQVQFRNPKIKFFHKIFKMDDESEADLYAIIKLTEWRKKNGII